MFGLIVKKINKEVLLGILQAKEDLNAKMALKCADYEVEM